MLIRALIPAAAAAAVALTFAGPATARSSCGMTGGAGVTPSNIHATHTSCHTARGVATRVAKVPSFGGCTASGSNGGLFIRQPCKRKGYRCHGKHFSQGLRVRCTRGAKRIRFDLIY
jgi:hypothetical protein